MWWQVAPGQLHIIVILGLIMTVTALSIFWERMRDAEGMKVSRSQVLLGIKDFPIETHLSIALLAMAAVVWSLRDGHGLLWAIWVGGVYAGVMWGYLLIVQLVRSRLRSRKDQDA